MTTTSKSPASYAPDTSSAAGLYGQHKRAFGADDPRTLEALGVLTASRIVGFIRKALRDSPALTDEQIALITSAAGGAR